MNEYKESLIDDDLLTSPTLHEEDKEVTSLILKYLKLSSENSEEVEMKQAREDDEVLRFRRFEKSMENLNRSVSTSSNLNREFVHSSTKRKQHRRPKSAVPKHRGKISSLTKKGQRRKERPKSAMPKLTRQLDSRIRETKKAPTTTNMSLNKSVRRFRREINRSARSSFLLRKLKTSSRSEARRKLQRVHKFMVTLADEKNGNQHDMNDRHHPLLFSPNKQLQSSGSSKSLLFDDDGTLAPWANHPSSSEHFHFTDNNNIHSKTLPKSNHQNSLSNTSLRSSSSNASLHPSSSNVSFSSSPSTQRLKPMRRRIRKLPNKSRNQSPNHYRNHQQHKKHIPQKSKSHQTLKFTPQKSKSHQTLNRNNESKSAGRLSLQIPPTEEQSITGTFNFIPPSIPPSTHDLSLNMYQKSKDESKKDGQHQQHQHPVVRVPGVKMSNGQDPAIYFYQHGFRARPLSASLRRKIKGRK